MKGAALFIAIMALAILIIPLIALSFEPASPQANTPVHSPGVSTQTPNSAADNSEAPVRADESYLDVPAETQDEDTLSDGPSLKGVSSFRILDESTGEVAVVSVRDYLRGAVAAEMPASFHPEALKAQAVAAHTFALNQHYRQLENPDPALKGADFSADPSNMQIYITEETARAFLGDNADLYWEKICDATDSVMQYVLEYEDEPIVAAYHAMSAGRTEDASNVWTGEAPYLQPSDSEGDLLAPDFETVITLHRDNVEQTLLHSWPGALLPEDPTDWFRYIQRSDSGYITYLEVGGVELHGKDIRTAFDLRSHNIDIEYDSSSGWFTFYVYGYGHGVGLSQYGADFLARQGYTFDEILHNYYTGVTLKEVSIA